MPTQSHFPCARMRSRSTPAGPNAFLVRSDALSFGARRSNCFPMCSGVLSLDACRSRCKSYVVRCALARQLSIQLRVLWAQVCSRATPVDRFDICSASCLNRFCLDLDQAIFEPRYACPKSLQICFQIASLGCFFSRSGSSHSRVHIHIPKTIVDLFPHGFIRSPCRPDLDQAIF